MTDIKRLLLELRTLTIFRSLRFDPVISEYTAALEYAVKNDKENALEHYCCFASRLYESYEDFSEYIIRKVLENENIFVKKKGADLVTGDLLDSCVANELDILQKLSMITSFELTEFIDYDGALPEYSTSWLDFQKIYNERIKAIKEYGYGIYSKYHVFMLKDGQLSPVEYPDMIMLSQLHDYERERGEVIANTLALLNGKPANNVLLYGDCGTGKSSTVKAIANEYALRGLRLIELKKKQLHEIPTIIEQISDNPLKFIVFIDDLSFTEDDSDYAALKAILEGSVASTASNLVIYATSNRRHLVKETFSARKGDEVHFKDTMQEILSLSDRFGLTVTFQKPDKKLYLDIVEKLAREYELEMDPASLELKAEQFALTKGGRSPRVAKQFVEYIKGCEEI